MTTARQPTGSAGVVWASGLNALAGLWLLISPWILGYTDLETALWNDVILGIAIGVIGAVRASGAYRASWLSWVNLVLGAWVLISPWVLGFVNGNAAATWNNVITGIAVVVLAGWSILATGSPNRNVV